MTVLIEDWLDNFDPNRENFNFYDKLIEEELTEFNDEPDDLKEACDLIWVATAKALQIFTSDQINRAMVEVYQSNMSKISDDHHDVAQWIKDEGIQADTIVKEILPGKFIAVQNSKVLKGPKYKKAHVNTI